MKHFIECYLYNLWLSETTLKGRETEINICNIISHSLIYTHQRKILISIFI